MQTPTIMEVAQALHAVVRTALSETHSRDIDVRLQVYENGEWAIRYGPSDYDQDHRGYWGAASVHYGMDVVWLEDVARHLIEQVEEQQATR